MHFECTFRSYPHSPPFGGLTIYIRLRTCSAGYNEKEDFCRMLKGKRETILVVDNDETVLDSVVLIPRARKLLGAISAQRSGSC